MMSWSYDVTRRKLTRWLPAEAQGVADAIVAPADLATLVLRAMTHPDVPSYIKARLVFAGLYTVSGLDLVPEALFGPVGLVDDGITVIAALDGLLNEVDPLLVASMWSGPPETLQGLQRGTSKLRQAARQYVVEPVAKMLRWAVASVVRAATSRMAYAVARP